MKIIDFGLSDSDAFFILKHPAGTTGFIAPEQFMPDAKAEPRTDIFSLGMVIAEIATSIGDKKLEKIAKICTTHNPLLRPSSIEILRKRLLEKPQNRNVIILLGCSHWHILLLSAPSDQTKRSHYGAVSRRR